MARTGWQRQGRYATVAGAERNGNVRRLLYQCRATRLVLRYGSRSATHYGSEGPYGEQSP